MTAATVKRLSGQCSAITSNRDAAEEWNLYQQWHIHQVSIVHDNLLLHVLRSKA